MSDDRHETERVYDEEMGPLVAQLIAISKRAGVPLFVNAGMVDPEGLPRVCVTYVRAGDEWASGIDNRHSLCSGVVKGHSGMDTAAGLMITRHHPQTEVSR